MLPKVGTTPLYAAAKVPTNCTLMMSSRYTTLSGVPVELTDGTVIEGSQNHGGLQPNFFLDYSHPSIVSLREFAATSASEEAGSLWQRINLIRDHINQRVLLRTRYDDPEYLGLLEMYREDGQFAIAGDYAEFGCGSCREHAILTSIALSAAGIRNRYVYVRMALDINDRGTEHALILVNINGEEWVVDTYFPEYHQRRFNELFGDIPEDQSYIPLYEVLPFPRYWIPN